MTDDSFFPVCTHHRRPSVLAYEPKCLTLPYKYGNIKENAEGSYHDRSASGCGTVLRMANRLAENPNSVYVDIKVNIPVYAGLEVLPRLTKPNKNVVVSFAYTWEAVGITPLVIPIAPNTVFPCLTICSPKATCPTRLILRKVPSTIGRS